ncbi:MAG: lecithin retinol acyltransferase family protein [Cyanobacteriota bacterium]|nr:lecithin retinol acyltransferase family protein [Cyanobacteriota bacterium]
MKAQEIKKLVDKYRDHHKFGRLLYHRDKRLVSVIHYAVRLNDNHALMWESVNGKTQGKGKIKVHKINWKYYRKEKKVHHLSKNKIAEAIYKSANKHHYKKRYDILKFNCEHWARWVTTGKFKSYQISHFPDHLLKEGSNFVKYHSRNIGKGGKTVVKNIAKTIGSVF